MAKFTVKSGFLADYRQVQLRTYKTNGKYLEPIKQWYRIGDEWGLKIKKGHYSMKNWEQFIEFLNKKMDELEKKKIPYELMFFDGSMNYKDVHNMPQSEDGWEMDCTKLIARKVDDWID